VEKSSTSATKSGKTSYRQAHEGLSHHAGWIRQRPTVILGDFNMNATWGRPWQDLMALTEPLGLVSAYHEFFSEQFGKETQPTHFHKGKEAAPFHVDYCFLPGRWRQHVTKVEVGTYAKWHDVSDHAPVVVDLDLSL
jgi:endonuclease/exonuclease/phosphatase family metal-dependent hydrolase